MPSRNKGGCTCCQEISCCIPLKDLYLDFDTGQALLPTMDNIIIDADQGSVCSGITDGYYSRNPTPNTTTYTEDFGGETIGTRATDLGWTKHSGSVNPTAWWVQNDGGSQVLMQSAPGAQAIERTFAADGTFYYDWHCDTEDEVINIYVNGALARSHSGIGGSSRSGRSGVAVFAGNAVRIEASTLEDDAWVDNLEYIDDGDPGPEYCIGSWQGNGWERPPEYTKTIPSMAVGVSNFDLTWDTNQWDMADTGEQGFVIKGSYPPEANDGTYYFGFNDTMRRHLSGPSGDVVLEQGSEPDIWPYMAHASSFVYTDAEGDCILRIGFKFVQPEGRYQYSPAAGGFQFNQYWKGNSSSFIPLTDWFIPGIIAADQYSTHHPCYMASPLFGDAGYDPFYEHNSGTSWTGQDFYMIFLSSFSEDFPPGAFGPTNPVLGTWTPTNNIPTYDCPIFAEGGEQTWIWEINLTDEGITDLASLPDTTLDASNMAGVLAGGYAFTDPSPSAIAAKPAGWDAETYYWHSPGSCVVDGSFIDIVINKNHGTDAYPGGHSCVADPDPCPWDYCSELAASDTWRWFIEFEVTNSTFTTTNGAFSFTLKGASS